MVTRAPARTCDAEKGGGLPGGGPVLPWSPRGPPRLCCACCACRAPSSASKGDAATAEPPPKPPPKPPKFPKPPPRCPPLEPGPDSPELDVPRPGDPWPAAAAVAWPPSTLARSSASRRRFHAGEWASASTSVASKAGPHPAVSHAGKKKERERELYTESHVRLRKGHSKVAKCGRFT